MEIEREQATSDLGRGVRRIAGLAGLYQAAAAEALAETLWPTRCAVCDDPGEVLCARCRDNLAYLDWWRACPRCGAPYGSVQCTECNEVMLAARGLEEPPYAGCASATLFNDDSARIVRTWKDAGERRLGDVMADVMAPFVPPSWKASGAVVVPVPATTRALRRRGFDHGRELAEKVAGRIGLPAAELLARPHVTDQRKLSRTGRLENMEGRFRALPGADVPRVVLLVDDVMTTGATLSSAACALSAAGAQEVYGLTFTRVF